MDEYLIYTSIIIITSLALIVGYLLAHIKNRRQMQDLKQKYYQLNAKLSEERSHATEKDSSVEKMRSGLEETLTTLSRRDLSSSNEEAVSTFSEDRSLKVFLRPLGEALKNTERHIQRIQEHGLQSSKLLTLKIKNLRDPQMICRGSSEESTEALGDEKNRDLWGNRAIRHLITLANLEEHCSTADGNSSKEEEEEEEEKLQERPSLITTANNDIIIIDPTAPLEAYQSLFSASDESVCHWHQESHARKLRERIHYLSSHSYHNKFTRQPVLIILLALNNHYITSALEIDKDLLIDAEKHNIILATPADVLNLLQTISYGWQQNIFSADACQIRETGLNLYRRFNDFSKLIERLGTGINALLSNNIIEPEESEQSTSQKGSVTTTTPSEHNKSHTG